jgi:glycosyltransferase involved in cell wall biosynthesis
MINISEAMFHDMRELTTNNRLIYGGVDIDYWKPDIITCENIVIYNNTIKIANIGQLTRWKNNIDFINAAKLIYDKCQNVEFLIIGEDLSGREKKYKKELYKLVNDLGLQNKIHFYGYREDIIDIMNNIDILVHTAKNEPFGRVLIEAMAMEKPVVAYNCGGPSEIIVNKATGFLVEPYNYRELAEKTMELVQDKELRLKFGKAGRQRVIEKFNIKRYVREMEKVFDNL